MSSAKTILWLTWKDTSHPQAGGAEVVNEALAKRLASRGYKITFLVAGFDGYKKWEERDGYKIHRMGNRYSVYWHAYRSYKTRDEKWDLVIDEMNTAPFFARYYSKQPTLLFTHMLARKIWFYQMPGPLGVIGFLMEPIYLRLLSGSSVVTVSESTRADLMRHGFEKKNIDIISEGIDIKPINDLKSVSKYTHPTMLSFGSVRPMKRTHIQLEAFNIAKESVKDLRLIIAGPMNGKYGAKVRALVEQSPYKNDIDCLGPVSTDKKLELYRKCHIITVTSIKEGWGLIVTEAASQGTPAIVYDVDGLRDSVRHKETGIVTECKPDALASAVIRMFESKQDYQSMRVAGWRWSKTITFDKSVAQFEKIITKTQSSL